ncbi:MAG: hypothetical protein NXI30_27070 [bacterium]|nr:hypothetical protein [bacterium]
MCRRIAGRIRTGNRASAWATGFARGALGALALSLTLSAPAGADPASPARAAGDEGKIALLQVPPTRARTLDTLLIVPPGTTDETAAQRTDASLAAAVARGGDRRVAATGFRKRSIDLFSHERPVEFGEQEMLLRLRLRAKSRETMSVELRF